MARTKRITFSKNSISINDVAIYHQDVDASLRMLFTSAKLTAYHPMRLFITSMTPGIAARFVGKGLSQIDEELVERLYETELRSALAMLASLDAAFRIDYLQRCQQRKRDQVSRAFRVLYAHHGSRVRLEDDIFETWRQVLPSTAYLVSQLKGAFKYRHWLAHGRFWEPKHGGKYDYQGIYILAQSVLANFPLYRR
jgi:hypothetical protein